MKAADRPSRRQAEILAALVKDGSLPDYFNRATTDALLRRAWVERVTVYGGVCRAALSATLKITTRGRWALRAYESTPKGKATA